MHIDGWVAHGVAKRACGGGERWAGHRDGQERSGWHKACSLRGTRGYSWGQQRCWHGILF